MPLPLLLALGISTLIKLPHRQMSSSTTDYHKQFCIHRLNTIFLTKLPVESFSKMPPRCLRRGNAPRPCYSKLLAYPCGVHRKQANIAEPGISLYSSHYIVRIGDVLGLTTRSLMLPQDIRHSRKLFSQQLSLDPLVTYMIILATMCILMFMDREPVALGVLWEDSKKKPYALFIFQQQRYLYPQVVWGIAANILYIDTTSATSSLGALREVSMDICSIYSLFFQVSFLLQRHYIHRWKQSLVSLLRAGSRLDNKMTLS